MKNKRGFTLIELLAVIVILAIIALIATPMVLKYIENAKEGSNDISVESILRAADNYYASSLLDKTTTYPIQFDLSNKEAISNLGLKGRNPDSGQLMIYNNGETYLEAVYDGISYVKGRTETKISKINMVIGSSALWTTNGQGKITKYKGSDEAINQQIEFLFMNYVNYISTAAEYAVWGRTSSTSKLDYSKSLIENVEIMEKNGELSRTGLPLELNKEIDIILETFDLEEAISEEEGIALLTSKSDKLPHTIDLMNKTEMLNKMDKVGETTVYQLIANSVGLSNTVVIPNYVKHENGKLEKITTVATHTFRLDDGLEALNCYLASEVGTGKDLIISNGITDIEPATFAVCALNSVVLPNTIEIIEESVFNLNSIDNIILPNSITTIKESAFGIAGLKGTIKIPNSVTTIDKSAFASGEECDPTASNYESCMEWDPFYNKIENVIFESNSKILTIGDEAFINNKLTTITIPGSIKSIGKDAFNMSTLTSATIERAQGSDLTIGENAFGSVTPTYQS